MKVRAKHPLRYKDVRYEPNVVFEIEPDDLAVLEPYVVQEEEENLKITNKKGITNINKKNYGNITTNTNRRSNENTTAINENLD